MAQHIDNDKMLNFNEIENASYTFTSKDLKKLGLELDEIMLTTKKAKKGLADYLATLTPQERAKYDNEQLEYREDIAIIQKFTGNKQTKTKKAQEWLFNMYA